MLLCRRAGTPGNRAQPQPVRFVKMLQVHRSAATRQSSGFPLPQNAHRPKLGLEETVSLIHENLNARKYIVTCHTQGCGEPSIPRLCTHRSNWKSTRSPRRAGGSLLLRPMMPKGRPSPRRGVNPARGRLSVLASASTRRYPTLHGLGWCEGWGEEMGWPSCTCRLAHGLRQDGERTRQGTGSYAPFPQPGQLDTAGPKSKMHGWP